MWNRIDMPGLTYWFQSLQAPTNGSWIHGCHAYGTPQPRCCDREIIIVSTDVNGLTPVTKEFHPTWSLLCTSLRQLWVLKVCPFWWPAFTICVVPFFVAGASTWRLGVQAQSPGSDRSPRKAPDGEVNGSCKFNTLTKDLKVYIKIQEGPTGDLKCHPRICFKNIPKSLQTRSCPVGTDPKAPQKPRQTWKGEWSNDLDWITENYHQNILEIYHGIPR